jgi:GAF domain-containing protein
MSDLPDPHPGRDVDVSGLHTRIVDDRNLQAALQRVATAGCQLLSGCAGASVTIIERGRPTTVSSTTDAAVAVDLAQYDADDGPCLSAAREERAYPIDNIILDDRWPEFRAEALVQGFGSSLSVPMFLGGDIQSSLNVYGAEPGAFSDDDERLATTFVAQASVVVANAHAYWSSFEVTRNLTTALANRAVIEQAKGVLITRHGYADDEAFAELRQRSQRANRKLRDVAVELVDEARRQSRP